MQHADEYVRSLELDYAAVPVGKVGVNALVLAVRQALARAGPLVEQIPHETRPPASGLEGLDTPHFTCFVLTASCFGPQLDVYGRAGDGRTQR